MKREQMTVVVLVAVVAVLATLLAVDFAGGRPAQAQATTSSGGFISVVGGELYSGSNIPIIVVDGQQMAIMTYNYKVVGPAYPLTLTNVRSFRFDRQLNDYNVESCRRAPERPAGHREGNSVEEIFTAVPKQKMLR